MFKKNVNLLGQVSNFQFSKILHGNLSQMAARPAAKRQQTLFILTTSLHEKPATTTLIYCSRLRLSTDTTSGGSGSGAGIGGNGSRFVKNTIKYLASIGLGVSLGLLTGYYLMLDQFKFTDDQNEAIRSFLNADFQPTKFIEYRDSPYHDFPLAIHVYQYESCPYCAQIRAYLDYFGFSYKVTEVDSYSKEELTRFTKARLLPIVVLEDRTNKKRWHLANATAIYSALESVRNEKLHINFADILNQYLPVLKMGTSSSLNSTINPYKYHVTNSDLNSIEWRKWINNYAIPAFRLNSIATFKDLIETFDFYSEKSQWRARYNQVKYYYVYLENVYKTYKQRSSYIKQLAPEYTSKEPRVILNQIIQKWEDGLANNLFISGTAKPNLADLSFYGSIKSFEGCALFRESIAKHAKFRAWYERMRVAVIKRNEHNETTASSLILKKKPIGQLLKSIDESTLRQIESEKETSSASASASTSPRQTPLLDLKFSQTPQSLSQAEVFRILSVNYLVHVVIFTYAAWMSR